MQRLVFVLIIGVVYLKKCSPECKAQFLEEFLSILSNEKESIWVRYSTFYFASKYQYKTNELEQYKPIFQKENYVDLLHIL